MATSWPLCNSCSSSSSTPAASNEAATGQSCPQLKLPLLNGTDSSTSNRTSSLSIPQAQKDLCRWRTPVRDKYLIHRVVWFLLNLGLLSAYVQPRLKENPMLPMCLSALLHNRGVSVVLTVICFFLTNVFPYVSPGYTVKGKRRLGAPMARSPKENYCDKCNTAKPPRAHHCSQCDRCCLIMDHHCHILSNCVGQQNHRLWMCLLYFMFFLLLWSEACVVTAIIAGWQPNGWKTHPFKAVAADPFAYILFVSYLYFIFQSFMFISETVRLRARGATLIEDWQRSNSSLESPVSYADRGVCANLLAFWCRRRDETLE